MTKTHTYSTVLYDISWTNIGNAVDAIESLDNLSGVSIQAKYDTSGGKRDNGTTYSTEAVLTVRKEYSLGGGDVALDELANTIAELTVVNKSALEVKSDVRNRG